MGFVAFKKAKMREAIDRNDIAQMKLLLDKGVSPDLIDDDGTTFLFYAVEKGNHDAVRLLIDRGATVDHICHFKGTYLHAVAVSGSVEIAQMLIEKNPELLNVKSRLGNSPLHMAARRGYADFTAFLISKGADTEMKNYENRTALFLAQIERHEDVIKLLKPYQKIFAPVLPAPAPAAITLVKQQEVLSRWEKLSEDKIAKVTLERPINYKLTEIFNFRTRERTQIYANLETKAETADTKKFSELTEIQPVEEALGELQKRGGSGSINPLQKAKPTSGRI